MSGIQEWFESLNPYGQIFFGLFVAFIALPIATLTVLQLVESVRSSRESTRNYGKTRDKDEKEQR